MRDKFLNWLGDLQYILWSGLFLMIAYLVFAVMYGYYNIPDFQNPANIERLGNEVKYSFVTVLMVASLLSIPQRLFDFVIRSNKQSEEKKLIAELKESVDILVKQNKVLIDRLENEESYTEQKTIIV